MLQRERESPQREEVGAHAPTVCPLPVPAQSAATTYPTPKRHGCWDKLTTVQQWLCEQVLGIEPAVEDEKPQPRRTQADKWAMNHEAAKQFYGREGHLRVPRKHIERITVNGGEGQEERELRLGASGTSAAGRRR
jgi:hypothetical protein